MAEQKKENNDQAAERQSEATEIARLQAELVAAQQKIEELTSAVANEKEAQTVLIDSNTELQAKLEESDKTVEEVKVIVTHDKKKYAVITPSVQYAGKRYLAAELKKNPDVVKVLVEKGSGVLKAI